MRFFFRVRLRRHDPGAAALQYTCIRRNFEPAVDDDALRLARRRNGAHRQLRIVFLDGADAGQHRAGARAPSMTVIARFLRRNPLRCAIMQGRLAVKAGGRLHPHPWQSALHARKKTDVDLDGFALHHAARSFSSPCPATSGFRSVTAATTRATPALIKASAHGGVRPKWLHGSSVTYTVALRTSNPSASASCKACTLACVWPGGCVWPSPMT